MIVQIASGSSGWGEYVLGRDERREGATLVAGDIELGDEICKSTDYKSGQYARIVLSFSAEDEHITPEIGREIAKEFVDLFMHGYRQDEYHVDIVEHTDTDNLHYHIRIPKLNLLTGTQLKVYYDRADRSRKEAIVDWLDHKYQLTRAVDRRRTPQQKSEAETERIQKWRSEHGQKPFDFRRKKGREKAHGAISAYIEELAAAGLISSQAEVVAVLEDMGLKVEKIGHDKKQGFDYITVSNETGKLRLKGAQYGESFWQHTGKDQAQPAGNRKRDRELKERLDRELEKRARWIAARYRRARETSLGSDRADTRIEVDERPVEAMRSGIDNRGGDRSSWSSGVGVEKRPNLQQPGPGRNVDQDQVKGGDDDRVGAEALRRAARARAERAAAVRRIREQLGADQEQLRARVEASGEQLRKEAERVGRAARESRGRRAVIGALEWIGEAIERLGKKIRGIKAGLGRTLRADSRAMEWIRERSRQDKAAATEKKERPRHRRRR